MSIAWDPSGWRGVAQVRDAHGDVHAVLESAAKDAAPPEQAARAGAGWQARPWATLARRQTAVVLDRALHPLRVRCTSGRAAAVLARALAGTRAQNALEEAVLKLAARAGLVGPTEDGLPEPEHAGEARAAWSENDARFLAGFGYDAFGGAACGATWTGHRGEEFPGGAPRQGARERARITLGEGRDVERALPRSAQRFATDPIERGALERWLGRFARARARHTARRPGGVARTYRRGCPEGGGGGTTGVTLAVLDVRGLDRGVYRYDLEDHALVEIEADAAVLAGSVRKNYDGEALGCPPVVAALSARMERMGAKYTRMTLSTSMINAGVFLAGAYRAAALEGLAVRGCGMTDVALWQETLKVDPLRECVLCTLGLGYEASTTGVEMTVQAPGPVLDGEGETVAGGGKVGESVGGEGDGVSAINSAGGDRKAQRSGKGPQKGAVGDEEPEPML